MAFLAIAEGAVRVGKKIFAGVKDRRRARKIKRAVKQTERDLKLSAAESNIFGSQGIIPDSGISQSAASFQNMIGQAGFVDQVQNREQIRLMAQDSESGAPGISKNMLIIGGAAVLFLVFGKKLLR